MPKKYPFVERSVEWFLTLKKLKPLGIRKLPMKIPCPKWILLAVTVVAPGAGSPQDTPV